MLHVIQRHAEKIGQVLRSRVFILLLLIPIAPLLRVVCVATDKQQEPRVRLAVEQPFHWIVELYEQIQHDYFLSTNKNQNTICASAYTPTLTAATSTV